MAWPGLDAGDLNVIDTFFSRALDLDLDKRAEIAGRIADRMSTKMRGSAAGRNSAGAGCWSRSLTRCVLSRGVSRFTLFSFGSD